MFNPIILYASFKVKCGAKVGYKDYLAEIQHAPYHKNDYIYVCFELNMFWYSSSNLDAVVRLFKKIWSNMTHSHHGGLRKFSLNFCQKEFCSSLNQIFKKWMEIGICYETSTFINMVWYYLYLKNGFKSY